MELVLISLQVTGIIWSDDVAHLDQISPDIMPGKTGSSKNEAALALLLTRSL